MRLDELAVPDSLSISGVLSQIFSFETPRNPTEHTLVEARLASACIRSFRSARADYRAGSVAAVFGVRAPRASEAATDITSFADRTTIAARIAEPSAARYRYAFKRG